MAVTTKILADTKTHAKVLLTWNADAATTAAAVDASGLSGHANGAKLHITNIVYGVGLGECKLEFVGASSDVEAINLCGSGHYYGAVTPLLLLIQLVRITSYELLATGY